MLKTLLVLLTLGLIIVAIVLPPLGCQPGGIQSGLRTVQMQIGTRTFTLEVADTDSSRQYGLMHRDSLPADHGMLFVFEDERPLGFWMKNTRIPLDILYVDAQGRVVSIHQMKPHDLSTTSSDGPAQYAIELNEGAAARAGVKPGDHLPLPPSMAN
ncbi:MAG TPA: DUF192 domain-containing protein [Tepidisphaeraceae bacterium]|nr:DUF192 domain-containing protein [Tepidisphaeraceae bacterium]